MTDKRRLFPLIEKVLILIVLAAVFLSLGTLRLQRPSAPDGVEQLDGWYSMQNGQRVDVELPCSLTLDGGEDLVLYNDSLSSADASNALTTRGAVYRLRILLGDQVLYAYEDSDFPRNEQMRSKLYCTASLQGDLDSQRLSLVYQNPGDGHFQLSAVYLGSSSAVFRWQASSDVFTFVTVFTMLLIGIIALGIHIYLLRNRMPAPRFANVAFSNGSLPLGWLNRLRLWQPLSCPLGIRRFFVSPIESGELCLIASVLGASGDIFFPKLDEARDMIPFDAIIKDLLEALNLGVYMCEDSATAKTRADQLRHHLVSANLSADAATDFIRAQGGYPVEFFASDTSGEKTFEEFFTATERLDMETFTNLGIVKETPIHPRRDVEAILAELQRLFQSKVADKAAVVNALSAYLPNFHHIEKGRSLDNRM